MCECSNQSMDIRTPRNVQLSGFYKRSFAYYTVKDRLPVIVTQLIDMLSRTKLDIIKKYGEEAKEDVKRVIGTLSYLKYQIQTNHSLLSLTTDEPDIKWYNDYIEKRSIEDGEVKYFNTIWLLSECYMYRKIKEDFTLTKTLKNFDYFRINKEEAFWKCQQQLASCVTVANIEVDFKERFDTLLKMNLWGNKCDLSISLGHVQDMHEMPNIHNLDEYILANDSDKFIQYLESLLCQKSHQYIDVVFDNSGYELITDLILLTAITAPNDSWLKVRFHVKSIPWFISDVMEADFNWTVQQVCKNSLEEVRAMGEKWKDFLDRGVWEIATNLFWTSPFEFKHMKEYAPELFSSLNDSGIVIFKGDLNYRKLFGEFNWDPTTPASVPLQEVGLKRVLSIRTVKADIICGLREGLAEELDAKDPKWMEKGDYGVIHFYNSTD